MPASKNPGPQDQKKRKEWSTPRLRLLSVNGHQDRPLGPPVIELSGPSSLKLPGQTTVKAAPRLR